MMKRLLFALIGLLIAVGGASAQSPPGPPGMLRDASNATLGSLLNLELKNNNAINGLVLGGSNSGSNWDLCLQGGGGLFVACAPHGTGNLTIFGNEIFSSSSATLSNPGAGQLIIYGLSASSPTLGGNGSAVIFISSTLGLELMGEGSTSGVTIAGSGTTNDLELFSTAGVVAWIPHGSSTFAASGEALSGALGTPAAGTLLLSGSSGAPTLGANNEGAIFTTAILGLELMGQGSTSGVTIAGNGATDDLELYSTAASGTVVARIAHGATTFTALNLTVTTNLTLSSITGSIQCLQVSSAGVVTGTGSSCGGGGGAPTNLALSGSLQAPAAGTLLVSGSSTAPSLGANDEGAIWLTSANGLNFEGQGSVNDLTFLNKGGSVVCDVPTGTTIIACGGVQVTNSNNPTNGIYLPAANTLGLAANGSLVASVTSTGMLSLAMEITGTSAFSPSSGYLLLSGIVTVPALGANGEGSISLLSAGGIAIEGQGSIDDLRLLNKSGAIVANIPTGSTNLNAVSLNINGTSFGTVAAGTLLLGGIASTPSLGANGEAAIYLSTSQGLQIQGKGSVNDLALLNDSGAQVCTIATGSGTFSCGTLSATTGNIESLSTQLAAFTGTGNPTVAVGTIGIAGLVGSAPTLGANGEAEIYLTTVGGLILTGQGSINDLELLNKSGTIVANIPTGTTIWNMNSGQVNGTTLPTLSSGVLGLGGLQSFNPSTVNGSGALFVSTVNGVELTGQGSTYDVAFVNVAGVVAGIPTGAAEFYVDGNLVLGSSSTSLINGISLNDNLGGLTVGLALSNTGTLSSTFVKILLGNNTSPSEVSMTLNGSGSSSGNGANSFTIAAAAGMWFQYGSTNQLSIGNGVVSVLTELLTKNEAVTGTSLPTQAAGTLGLGGETAVPTLGAAGEADVFIDATTGALALIGEGLTNDFEVFNKNSTLVLNIPSGTTNLTLAGNLTISGLGGTTQCLESVAGVVTGTGVGCSGSITQVTKTSNYNVTSSDNGTFFDITGASGTVIFTLPSYAAGLHYCFFVTAAQILEVLAPASNKIAVGLSESASAGNIQNASIYSSICLIAGTVSNQWESYSSTGGAWGVN